jgi:hypothetical protein
MQIMWHRTQKSSSLTDFADAAEIGPKSNQTGERFIFQGCTGELNALYDGHMQIIRNHVTAAGAPSCVGRDSDG